MKPLILLYFALSLVPSLVVNSQTTDKSATPQKSSVPVATVSFRSDEAAELKIDGRVISKITPGNLLSRKLELGDHLIEANSSDGQVHWEKVITLENTYNKIVSIELKPLREAQASSRPPKSQSAGGQVPASSPQSQATQSTASAVPPQAQPQAEDTPPCSDGRPILKRGKQPALPACPDPPPASPPADSAATHPPKTAESLIDRARQAAFEFSEKLPNFICEEFMSRFTERGRGEDMPLDVVSAEIVYDNSQESYRNVKINDRSTDKGMQELGGSWSTGEFASTLLELFNPGTEAQFRSGGLSSISGFSAQVYDFQVRSENSHWNVHFGSQSITAAYGGSVWIDPETGRVLRIEMQARNIPTSFPMDTVESSVDYSYVNIGGISFLLPVHAESLGCERGTSYCSHNIIDFRNYHEFTSQIKIGP